MIEHMRKSVVSSSDEQIKASHEGHDAARQHIHAGEPAREIKAGGVEAGLIALGSHLKDSARFCEKHQVRVKDMCLDCFLERQAARQGRRFISRTSCQILAA